MMGFIGQALRFAAVWAALAATPMVAAPLLGMAAPESPTASGALDAGQAFLVVTTGYALIISWIAARSRFQFPGRFALVLVTLILTQVVMTYSEVLFFGKAFDFAAIDLPRNSALTAITAVAVAVVAAAVHWMRRPEVVPSTERMEASAAAWAWRLLVAALAYLLAYSAGGILIAWSSAEVRAFYGEDAGVSVPALLGFQVLRGLVWSGLVVLLLASHRGAWLERALAAAIALPVLMAAGLLYPSDAVMPEAVRHRHLIEILASMIPWGLAASALLDPLVRGPARGRPQVPAPAG